MSVKAAAILAASLTVASSFPAKAGQVDFYLGVLGGYGAEERAPPAQGRAYSVDAESLSGAFYGAYGGIGWGLAAIEAGWLKLPPARAYAVGIDPPRTAHGSITGSTLFARALLRAPADWVLRPYGFAGVARVKAENHETGDCTQCGAGFRPDFRETLTALRPYVGVGVEFPLFWRLSGRAEF